MSILVDTSVWSYAFRRKDNPADKEAKLIELISYGLVRIIGPIRQELLSGIADKKQFKKLKSNLGYFHDIPLRTIDFELAAEFSNICRKNGIQGSNTDFLICAISYHHDLDIYTFDKDFEHFQEFLPIRLFNQSL